MPRWYFIRGPIGTNAELSKMDFVYRAQPFVFVPAKSSIDLPTLDYFQSAQPFVSYARG